MIEQKPSQTSFNLFRIRHVLKPDQLGEFSQQNLPTLEHEKTRRRKSTEPANLAMACYLMGSPAPRQRKLSREPGHFQFSAIELKLAAVKIEEGAGHSN